MTNFRSILDSKISSRFRKQIHFDFSVVALNGMDGMPSNISLSKIAWFGSVSESSAAKTGENSFALTGNTKFTDHESPTPLAGKRYRDP